MSKEITRQEFINIYSTGYSAGIEDALLKSYFNDHDPHTMHQMRIPNTILPQVLMALGGKFTAEKALKMWESYIEHPELWGKPKQENEEQE